MGKLDRAARNVRFISALLEAGVDFRAVKVPTAKLDDQILACGTLPLRAIAAGLDAREISTRTGAEWSHVQVLRLLRRAA
jgi:hypothetical protein